MHAFKHLVRSSALAATLAFCCVSVAHADTVYNSTGGMENGGDPLSPTTGAGPILADRFVAPTAAALTSVELNLSLAPNMMAANGFTVDLFADAGASGPGAVLLQIASVSDASLTSAFSLMTYMPTSTYLLNGGQSYYVGVVDNGSNAVLGNTLDPSVLSRSDVMTGASYYNSGGVQANAGGPYEVVVNTSPVPEPASGALLLSGMSLLGVAYRKYAARRTEA